MPKKQDPNLEIADRMADFFADPLGFVLYSYPWGEAGTILQDFPEGPDDWHRELFEDLRQHVLDWHFADRRGEEDPIKPFREAIASGHGIGKSTCLAWIIHWLMSTRINCRGVVTANTSNQLETKTWAELAKWHNLSIHKSWFTHTATSFYYNGKKDNWRVDAIPWTLERTESFAGLHNAGSAVLVIYDEASAIPPPIWEVSEGAMTDGEPYWFAFGNPTQNSGKFYDCFHRQRHRWRTRQIDSREVRITNKRQIQEWIDDYGEDHDFVKVRVRGMFPMGGSMQYIDGAAISDALARELDYDYNAERVLSADVARGGGDDSVLGLREGRILDKKKVWKYDERDSMKLAKIIFEKYKEHKPDAVHIDEAGLGGPVYDRLKEMGVKNLYGYNGARTAANPERHKNTRAEAYANLKEWLERADIPDVGMLEDDLRALEYDQEEMGLNRYVLETKKQFKKRVGRSCDWSDMLAISLFRPVRVQRREPIANGGNAAYAEADYDMFG